jgi:AsmA protein
MVSAESVQGTVSLSSLFGGHPRVSELVITRPTVRLLLRRKRIAGAPSATQPGGAAATATPQEFPLDRIIVEDGTVVMASPTDHTESRIEHVSLNASFPAPDGPFDVTILGHWGEQGLKLEVKGDGSPAALTTRAVAVQVSLAAPGVLQDDLLGTADVKVTGSTLAINNLTGTVGPGKFAGVVSVDFSSKPLVKADLDFQRLNLAAADSPSPSPGSVPGAAATTTDPNAPWSDRSIDIDALRFFDADVHITAVDFSYGPFRLAPAAVQATLDGGTLKAAFPRLGLYGGQADGTLLIDVNDAEPNHALRLNLNGVRALPLLTDLAGFNSIDGRLQAKIDVHAAGSSPRGVISALGGSADILVQDGELRGINVAQMVRNLMGTTLNGWQASRAEKTDLSALRALFRLTNGRATTQNLQMQGPLVRMTGAGTADINNATLDFKLEPKIVASLEGQGGASNPAGLGVPVVVRGPWSEPRIYPDVAGVLDNPDAAFDKLRELGGALFGNAKGKSDSPIPGLGNLFGRPGNDRKNTDPKGNNDGGRNVPPDPQAPKLDGILRDLFGR